MTLEKHFESGNEMCTEKLSQVLLLILQGKFSTVDSLDNCIIVTCEVEEIMQGLIYTLDELPLKCLYFLLFLRDFFDTEIIKIPTTWHTIFSHHKTRRLLCDWNKRLATVLIVSTRETLVPHRSAEEITKLLFW